MLSDSDLNPANRLKNRYAKAIQPANRADYHGNDATGMTQHYGDIQANTLDELKPVNRKAHATWATLPAIKNLRKDQLKLSDMVRSDKHDDFWMIYKHMRKIGFNRQAILSYIRHNATSE